MSLRRLRGAVACLAAASFVACPPAPAGAAPAGVTPAGVADVSQHGLPQHDAPRQAAPACDSVVTVRAAPACDPDAAARAAAALAEAGELDRAATLLSDALERWPDHPGLLAGLAGIRVRQGRPAEAEAVADHLVRIDPGSDRGWELLAASRYLQDDRRGALRAWEQYRPPVVREVEVDVLAHDGPRTSDSATDPTRLTGIAEGLPLTVRELARGERRLEALPAGSRTRLGYRALPSGDVALEGTVVLGARNPFTWPGLGAHAVRLVVGRVDIVSSDLLGHLERWELTGTVEGTLRSAGLAVAHPAPMASGVWRWEVAYATGRYGSGFHDSTLPDEPRAEEHAGVAWSHSDWLTGSLLGSVHGRVDVRPDRGTFVGAGVGGALRSSTGRGSVRLEATGWAQVAEPAEALPDPSTRFGRLALDAVLRPPEPQGLAAPSGLSLRGGVVTVSSGTPPDLLPRIGAGGNTSLLMRARSDLDDDGVVRALFPGRTWAHGGVEVLRSVGTVGPVGVGVAAFADGVRVLGRGFDGGTGSSDSDARRGAIHLGLGMRVRIPVVEGWLRADWAVDPADGESTVSAAWVSGARP